MVPTSRTIIFCGWLTLGIIWGTTWIFIRIGLRDLPPFTFAGLRFALAVVPLLCILTVRREVLPRRAADWMLMLGTGLLTITWNYGLVFWASRTISSGQTATLHATLPLFAIVFAHFLIGNERMTLRRLAGICSGVIGVALIFANEISFRGTAVLLASLAVIAAAMGMALSNVMVKSRGAEISPLVITAVQMLFGLVPLLAIGWLTEDASGFAWTPRAIFCLLYLAWVGSTFAFVLMFWLIQRMPVTLTQLTPFVSTVTAIVLGIVVLGEVASARFLGGVILILLGLLLSLPPRDRRRGASIEGSPRARSRSAAGEEVET